MAPPEPSSRSPSAARRREAQGRLFWTWLFALPILLILGASFTFGAPWPDRLLQNLAMLVLAFPILFVVGLPLFHLEEGEALGTDADDPDREEGAGPDSKDSAGLLLDRLVAGIATLGYVSGITALAGWTPNGSGIAALLVATYLTGRHLTGRHVRGRP